MISHTTPRFRKAYGRLPERVKIHAKSIYKLWLKTPYHQSLRFKQVHQPEPVYSIRIGIDWRALGIKEGNVMIWFWIGSREEYNNIISRI